jgi:hypothetical protein
MPSLAPISAVVTLQFSKNHYFSMLHVLFVCVCAWASLPMCINNTGSVAFKYFNPLVHSSLWQKVLFLQTPKYAHCMLLVLGANLTWRSHFMSCSLCTNGQLNHIHSMPPSDIKLQHGQVSAVLPFIQQKYSNIALTFSISFILYYSVSVYVTSFSSSFWITYVSDRNEILCLLVTVPMSLLLERPHLLKKEVWILVWTLEKAIIILCCLGTTYNLGSLHNFTSYSHTPLYHKSLFSIILLIKSSIKSSFNYFIMTC